MQQQQRTSMCKAAYRVSRSFLRRSWGFRSSRCHWSQVSLWYAALQFCPGTFAASSGSYGCLCHAGEGWAERVQKLALEHEDEGRLGTIYLDLYPR